MQLVDALDGHLDDLCLLDATLSGVVRRQSVSVTLSCSLVGHQSAEVRQ